MTNATVLGALSALSGFALFSLHDALIKSLAGYSVFQILFFAVLFSHVPFIFYIAADDRIANLRPRRPGWVALRSLCMVASACCAFYAFATLPLAQTYAVLFSMPMLVTLLAIPLLGERVRLFRWFAVALGLAGVFIALQPDAVGAGHGLQAGHLAALAAAAFSALVAVVTRKIGAGERSATLILYPLLANVLLSGVLMSFDYRPMPLADLLTMAAVGTLGLGGQLLIIRAYRAAPAALVAPFQYSQILWAVFYGYIWFGEVPGRYVFIGGSIIILAGLLIVWRETTGASQNRPYLRTRNQRAVSAAPMTSSECDERSGRAQRGAAVQRNACRESGAP